jgi:hypothetical protein
MSEKHKSTPSSTPSPSVAQLVSPSGVSLDDLLAKRSQLDDELRMMERQIFELEEIYLGEYIKAAQGTHSTDSFIIIPQATHRSVFLTLILTSIKYIVD